MQQAGNLVNVLGQRSGHNLYLLDCVVITDERFNNKVIAPSIDAIEEFNIRENVARSGIRRQVRRYDKRLTKSGSNDVHGSLFEFVLGFREKRWNPRKARSSLGRIFPGPKPPRGLSAD